MPIGEKQSLSTITVFHVAKTLAVEDVNRYISFPPEVRLVPNTIMLNLNDVSKRRCKHLVFAVVSILKRHRSSSSL